MCYSVWVLQVGSCIKYMQRWQNSWVVHMCCGYDLMTCVIVFGSYKLVLASSCLSQLSIRWSREGGERAGMSKANNAVRRS